MSAAGVHDWLKEEPEEIKVEEDPIVDNPLIEEEIKAKDETELEPEIKEDINEFIREFIRPRGINQTSGDIAGMCIESIGKNIKVETFEKYLFEFCFACFI